MTQGRGRSRRDWAWPSLAVITLALVISRFAPRYAGPTRADHRHGQARRRAYTDLKRHW